MQQREEFGELVTKGDQQILVVKGYYSYLNHGRLYRVNYRADENGYRAKITSKIAITSKRIGSNLIVSLAGGGLGWYEFGIYCNKNWFINKRFK